MHPKQHSTLHRMGVYCKHFALGFALICTQLTLSSASAQTIEPSEQTIQQAATLFEQGVAAADKGDFQQAIHNYTQVIALTPNHAGTYYNRGNAYSELKDYSSAIRDYTQAIALNPRFEMAYNNRALSLALQNDYRNATRDARKACSLGDCKVLEFLGQNSQLRD